MNKLAIIILHKNNNNILFKCLNSIQEKTTFKDYHIYIGDTGSESYKLQELKNFIKSKFKETKNVSLISFNYYNFPKNNNTIVKEYVKDENLLVFCNNDVELIDDCLTEAVKIYNEQPKNIGTIGFKLLFSDATIQHAGQLIVLTKQYDGYSVIGNNQLGLTHRGLRQNNDMFNKQETVVGNTGALMFTSKDLFLEVGGFNENYQDCFEDVEYNIQCLFKNKQNIYLPFKSWHHESTTRNNDTTKNFKMSQDAINFLVPFINSKADELAKLNLTTIIKQ